MGQSPLVSIVMNCYNGEKYLREAINSALAQTYQNWEIIFWDNQSTDRSAEIFKSYNDPRLKYFYAPKNTRLFEARNYAIEKTNGEFVSFLDVDDWWAPEKLEKQIPLFDDPEVGLVHSNYWFVNERKNTKSLMLKRDIPSGMVLNDLLADYFVGILTMVVRRSALEQLEYTCDSRFSIIGDLDLVVRLAVNSNFLFVDEPLAFYRWHGMNETFLRPKRELEELTIWYSEMNNHPVISGLSGLRVMQDRIKYLKGSVLVSEGDRSVAFSVWRSMSWGRRKAKLFIALILPAAIRKLMRQ